MERMNGGYIMLDMTTADFARVQVAYESGKMVIMFDGDSVQPATVTKSGSTYTVTGTKTAYAVTDDSKIKTNAAYDVYNYIADTGVKNFVKQNLTVPNEMECTVNNDMSLTVTAKTTAIRRLTIATDLSNLETGKEYILSGCTDGNANTTYHLGITKSNYAGIVYQTSAETRFTKTDDMALLVLTVQAGQNWTKTFYPMIRRAEIDSPEYMPYAPTNAQLYTALNALESRVAALENAATAAVSTRSKK